MRVALYSRVSTQEQAQHGLSIEAQNAALDEWAANHTVVDHYCDLGVSARSPASKRPELQRMLRDCEKGKIDLIVFTKLDRFFRNVKEYYKVEEILEKSGVSWRAIWDDMDTESAGGRLKLNLWLAISQDEADRTSERIKAVFAEKARKGLPVTGSVPRGVSIENGKYVANEDAPKVKEMFERYIATRSLMDVSRFAELSVRGVHYALRNHRYVEVGIVTQGMFDTVQGILSTRAQRKPKTDRVYLFAGIISCPYCGKKLSSAFVNGNTYYRCGRQFEGRCQGYEVNEKRVEMFLLEHLIPEMEVKVRNKKRPADVAGLKKRRDKLTDLYLYDLIDRAKYEEEYRAVTKAIEESEAQRDVSTVEVMSVLEAYETLSKEAKKAFWSALLKSIVASSEGFDFELNYT